MSGYKKLFLILPAAMVILDQITKQWIRVNLPMTGPRRSDRLQVIDGFFAIVHRENPGAAFGLFREFEYRRFLFLVVAIVATGVIFWMARELKEKQWILATALCLILAGAWGNAIDRAIFGSVTDFLEFRASGAFGDWCRANLRTNVFPQFNVADICVNVGVGLFIIHTLFFEKKDEESAA